MIPPTLDAFRALMQAAADVCDANEWPDYLIAPDLRALAAATPAQLLGIVGTVAPAAVYSDSQEGVRCFIVTPREDA